MLRKIVPALLLLAIAASCKTNPTHTTNAIETPEKIVTLLSPSITQTSRMNLGTPVPSVTPNIVTQPTEASPQIELFVISKETHNPFVLNRYVGYEAGTKVLEVNFGAINKSQSTYIFAFQERLAVGKCNWNNPLPTLYTTEGSSYPYTEGYEEHECGMGNVSIPPGAAITGDQFFTNPRLSRDRPFGRVYFQFPETETPEKIAFQISIFDEESIPVENQEVWLDLSKTYQGNMFVDENALDQYWNIGDTIPIGNVGESVFQIVSFNEDDKEVTISVSWTNQKIDPSDVAIGWFESINSLGIYRNQGTIQNQDVRIGESGESEIVFENITPGTNLLFGSLSFGQTHKHDQETNFILKLILP